MSTVRLTRRGRLLLRTLPLLLVLGTSLQVLAQRLDERRGPTQAVAAEPAPTPAVTVSRTPAPASPSPKATPKPSPKATPKTTRAAAYRGTGRLAVVPGTSAVRGTGPLRRYVVEVEAGLQGDPAAFAAAVDAVLGDPRGWSGGGRMSFQRVSSGPVSFRVTLASPSTTDRLCRPLDTGGVLSCWNGARAVLNAMRWNQGAASYRGDLASYRIYMVNHEVGHALGHGHRTSCGAGGLAPVMVQQTKSLYGCRRNPWPLAAER